MKDSHYVYMDQLELLDSKKPGPRLQARGITQNVEVPYGCKTKRSSY